MKRVLVLIALAACDGQDRGYNPICRGPVPCSLDAVVSETIDGWCNPLTQIGCQTTEKCTWVIDATMPFYVGHIGCAPAGTNEIGGACRFGPPGITGYDDCKRGGVCSSFGSPGTQGICKQVCDNQGGNPMCDATHACVVYPQLFSTGATSPPAAGVCDLTCDPLADNDFDGSGSALGRSGSACGSATVGCYGVPSGGTPPATAFTCMAERHYDLPLRHRTECTAASGCIDDENLYVNSCNQGYLPLFRESTAVSTAVCIAMCAPLDCYAGHCGSNDENRHGAAPHRCMEPDAIGSFGSGEECEYLWSEELDGSGHWLPSPWSDRVGFCFDHSQYLYDPTGGNNPTTPLPSCKDLPLHGSGSAFGADDFGCISSQTAGLGFTGKPRALPRTLYHREMR